MALQQHGDIIAANASAKAAGVTKHIAPDEARKLLRAVEGKVAHVHLEDGYRCDAPAEHPNTCIL